MKEIDVPKSANGFIYTIKSVEKTSIICPHKCNYIKDKDYDCWYSRDLEKLGINFTKGRFECIKVVINVKNIGSVTSWYVGEEDAVLVDDEGFSYKGIILCEDCLPPRTAEKGTHILPQTQVNYIQVFPIPDCQIARIKVNINHQWTDFHIGENNSLPFEGLETLSPTSFRPTSISSMSDETNLRWQIQHYNEKINKVKTNIFSRLNNILTESEKIKLENRIANDIYNLKIALDEKTDSVFEELRSTIQKIEDKYNEAIKTLNEKEKNRKTLSQKVDELLELSPREFEQYIGELFLHLGYSVEITQYSNDKGIDIIMTKDNTTYGVQCKRYKGTVGSPEIQKFIGALNHLQADKGYFVTTGMFSFEAEKMAAQHPIQLINRIDLAKLIIEAIEDGKQN